ncbi:MAG: phage/plasmid primase, P4 family [Eubacteriales bacterium]|nr:phage/plasmid primase, P4 family [Eubacteriales bacterium]
MNKTIIKSILKNSPQSLRKKYIFINDNRRICEGIATVGFYPLYIAQSQEDATFFTADELCKYIWDIANTGSCIMEYVFVLACYRKKTNDQIAEALKGNMVECLTGGYLLFKDKEYLGNYEKQGELEDALDKYIKRFEGGDTWPVDKLQFCRLDANGNPRGILDIRIVRYLMDRFHMFVMGSELYLYDGGVYSLDEKGVRIKAAIQEVIPEQFITSKSLNGVYSLLIDQQGIQKRMDEINEYPPDWINFQNGMFSVKDWKMYRHRPEYFSINQIPHRLDTEIKKNMDENGKQVMSFLDHAIPDKSDQRMMWQYLGYCMTRDTGMQKMMIIKGIGGTGKSRIIRLFQNIIGEQNFSTVDLEQLSQRFYPSLLFGKLLNACPDISSEALMSVANVKKATGEDTMIYERKGQDGRVFAPYAKLLYSANEIPLNLDEKSNAFYRRLLILEMNQKPVIKDLDLDRKLQAEAGYAIWMAIGGLRKLYEDGEFSESANSRELVAELYRAADSAKAFVDERLDERAGVSIKRSLVYEEYQKYCQEYGRKPYIANTFFRRMEDLGFIMGRTGKDGRIIKNVAFREQFEEDEEGEKVFR